jgi:hypothetical protein
MPDLLKPPPGARCACIHLACEHSSGECANPPVLIAKPLGQASALCRPCAELWGFVVDPDKPTLRY